MSTDLRIIAISTAAALVCFALARRAERNGYPWRYRFVLVLMLAAAGYLIFFGITIVRSGQQGPLMTHPWIANLEDGRSTLMLAIARNWAYGVILLGAALALQACKELFRSFWRRE
jgi:hypothetical protein